MTANPLSIYELARLRLEAFKLLEGWGTTHNDNPETFKKWSFDKRKKEAKDLADWAAS